MKQMCPLTTTLAEVHALTVLHVPLHFILNPYFLQGFRG
jgi:hypothetical protein